MDVKKLILEQKDYIVEVRRHLHENPEVGLKEFETIKYIERQLDAMGIAHKYVQNGGIIAEITCGKPGKTLLIRADMDALPMAEHNDFAWKSCKSGLMHGCGHDGHTAMLVGAARYLAAYQLSWNVAGILAPASFTWLLAHGRASVWLALLAVTVLGLALARVLPVRLPVAAQRIPVG